MAQTYNSTKYYVQSGDTVTHTTQSDINVLSSQCRWQGRNVTDTQLYVDANTYTNPTSVNTSNNTFEDYGGTDETFEVPTKTGSSWSSHSFDVNLTVNNSQADIEIWIAFDIDDDGNYATFSNAQYYQQHTLDPGNYLFNLYSYDGQEWSGEQAEFGIYINSGDSVDVTEIELVTNSEDQVTEKTEDPSVNVNSGTSSASYTGTLNGGEWTNWISMGGVSEGTNTFDHTIGGSNEANWEFEYTYEVPIPNTVGIVEVEDTDGNVTQLRLADPTDNGLVYDTIRLYTNGAVTCADVVDPGTPDESRVEIHTHNGTLRWRKDV